MVYASAYCMRWALLVTIPPRAAMIAISYAQTFLLTDAINYLETPREKRNVNHAYGLIGAAAIIYTGNAVRNSPPF
jgi:ATP-binding cassette subfamily C (CFTR/MRP) protein 1